MRTTASTPTSEPAASVTLGWDAGEGPQRAAEPWQLSILEFSLATAPLDELERVSAALAPETIRRLFEACPQVEELAVVRTCHRVEILALHEAGALSTVRAMLPGSEEGWRPWTGFSAVHHLHRVSAGLESLATGEREVREQVQRTATSVHTRHPRPVIAELVRGAVRAARELDGAISTRRSIAAIASARVLDEMPKPFPRVVVVGTGTVGRQVAEALGPYARVTLVYRTAPPPDAYLRSTGCRAAPLSDLIEELAHADAMVAAAKAGERILSGEDLAGRHESLVVVDLGLPRNVDPAAGALPHIRLVDLEDLYRGSPSNEGDAASDERVRQAAWKSWTSVTPWLTQPQVDHIMREAERLRRAELDRARAHLGPLTPAQQRAVDHLTRRLTEKLVRSPVQRLGIPPEETGAGPTDLELPTEPRSAGS